MNFEAVQAALDGIPSGDKSLLLALSVVLGYIEKMTPAECELLIVRFHMLVDAKKPCEKSHNFWKIVEVLTRKPEPPLK